MDEQLVNSIVQKVVADVTFWTAIVGFLGVIAGAFISIAGNIILFKIQGSQQASIDAVRKNLLHQMLSNPEFKDGRSIETLSKVTGSTAEECRKLLIDIGGRGFTLKDGREGWTYIINRPLSEQ